MICFVYFTYLLFHFHCSGPITKSRHLSNYVVLQIIKIITKITTKTNIFVSYNLFPETTEMVKINTLLHYLHLTLVSTSIFPNTTEIGINMSCSLPVCSRMLTRTKLLLLHITMLIHRQRCQNFVVVCSNFVHHRRNAFNTHIMKCNYIMHTSVITDM